MTDQEMDEMYEYYCDERLAFTYRPDNYLFYHVRVRRAIRVTVKVVLLVIAIVVVINLVRSI